MLKARAKRVNPTILLLVLLPLCGLAAGFEATLLSHRSEVQAVQSAYAVALATSRTQLATQLGKVTSDVTLAQNLTWKLSHSVASAMTGRLQKGALDQVALIDKGCTDLGRASFDHVLPVACPFTAGQTIDDGGFFPIPSGGKTALGLLRPLAGRTDIYAVGVVQLDDSWLGLHPELKDRLAALGLALGGEGSLLWQGSQANAVGMPPLTSDRALDRFLQSRLGREFADGNPLVWPLLTLAFACAALALWRDRARMHRETTAMSEFTLWCHALSPGAELALYGARKPEVSQDFEAALAAAKALVAQAQRLKGEMITGLTKKRHALEVLLRTRDDELAKQCRRLAELAELDSLAVQLSRTTTPFLGRMESFRRGADDLQDLVKRGLAEPGQTLHNMLLAWQRGVAERGARKFLRGLSETPGETEGRSQLDEQLDHLVGLAGSFHDNASSTLSLTWTLAETAAFAARLAGLWHGLALNPKDDLPCPSLLAAIDEAQTLVRLEPRFEDLAFSNLLGDADVPLPALPKPIWVSALYHLYLATAELVAHSGASVTSRLRVDGDKALFVIQVTGISEGKLPKRGETQAYHMEISRAILAPYHIGLVALPALSGPFPLAMTWNTVGLGHASESASSLESGGHLPF